MGPGYRERPPPSGVEAVVACLWEQDWVEPHVQAVIPDGCIDLLWVAGRELVVVGADTRPRREALAAHIVTSGIRVRAGAAGAFLGIPASEVRDQRVDVAALWGERGERLHEAMFVAAPEDRAALLVEAVVGRGFAPDPLVRAAVSRLARPGARVASVASELGVSERHFNRRMVTAVGYGPKMFARVARLRRLMMLPGGRLADRALEAGYASQAHMNEEVRRLTGDTPVRFLKDAGLTTT